MFEQAKLKLNWAANMLQQLDAGAKDFASKQRCEVLSEHDPETKELRLRIDGDFAPVWPSLVMLAGTVCQTINSGLDYITSEIVNTRRGTDRRIAFPVDVNHSQLKASQAIKTLRNVHSGVSDHILNEIKPTKMDNFHLWGVRNLANTDKHRNLVMAVHNQGFTVDDIKKAGMSMKQMKFTSPAGTQNEGYFSIPDVEEYHNPQGLIEIAFGEPDLRHPNRFYHLEILEFLSGGLNAAMETAKSIEALLRR